MIEALANQDAKALFAGDLLSWLPETAAGAVGFSLALLASLLVGMLIQPQLGRYRRLPIEPAPPSDETEPIREILDFVQSDDRLRQLIDVVPVLIFCAGPDGEPSYVNRPLIDYAGLSIEDFETLDGPKHVKAISSLIHPDERALVEQAWAVSFSTGAPFTALYRQRRADGVYRWTDGRAAPLRDADGNILQWIGVCLDIDDLVKSEATLKAREQELTRLIETVPSLIWSLEPDGQPSYFNSRLIEWFGLDVDDLEGEGEARLAATISAVVHPEDAADVDAALALALHKGQPFFQRYRLRRRSGDYRWIEARAEPLRDAGGKILQWYGVCLDIDENVRTQAALSEREQALTRLIDTVPSLIWSMNSHGEPTYFNRRLQDWLGFGIADLQASGPSRRLQILGQIIHPDWVAQVEEGVGGAIARGEPFTGKSPHRTAAGDYRWTETRLEPLRNAEGEILNWYGVMVDIDDEVRAQEALLTAQDRLARATQAASLAELSASIAHELNQPLSAVISNAQACQRWLAADPPNLERARLTAERIVRQSNAASDVVNGIRALFRQGQNAKAPAEIASVIAEVRDLMAAELRANGAVLSVQIDVDAPAALMDRVQIQQVLVNLVRNGVEASEAKPRPVTITVVAARSNAGGVRIDVVDEGDGIEDPNRVFEAFFSTKSTGMGMGLAICRSVIEAHQGRLWAESVQPHGARFSFTLPAIPTRTA